MLLSFYEQKHVSSMKAGFKIKVRLSMLQSNGGDKSRCVRTVSLSLIVIMPDGRADWKILQESVIRYSKCSKNGFHPSFTELIGNYSKHKQYHR